MWNVLLYVYMLIFRQAMAQNFPPNKRTRENNNRRGRGYPEGQGGHSRIVGMQFFYSCILFTFKIIIIDKVMNIIFL